MSIVLDGTAGITTPEIVSTGGPLVVNASAPDNSVVVDASGNVGIGTSSPSYKVHVVGGNATGFLLDNGGQQFTQLLIQRNGAVNTGGDILIDGTASTFSIRSLLAGPMTFNTSPVAGQPTERMRIDSSGNLLVGTTSSIYAVRCSVLSNGANIAAEFRVASNSLDTASVHFIKNDNNSTASNVFCRFVIGQGAGASGQINANGANSAAFGAWSDRRLKENIVNLPSQLDNICALRPVEFDYIPSEGGGHQIGFVAQEMQEVYPDVVGERSDGMLTVTGWDKTTARLVAAIQELKAINDAQAQTIESLTARVVALENQIV